MLEPGYRNNLGRLRSMGSVFMFYIYHAFPLLQIVATQLESEGICSGLATDNAGSLAAVNSAVSGPLLLFCQNFAGIPIFTRFVCVPKNCDVFATVPLKQKRQ